MQPDAPRIGILEDDPIMGQSLLDSLEIVGYRADWWTTGRDALDGVAREPVDLLLCDIRLPDMSGEEVMSRLEAGPRRAPVIFMTAYGEIEQAVRLVRGGAEDYLAKPFDVQKLLDRIAALLANRGAAAGAMGRSRAMREVELLLRRVAELPSTVLLTGESGVGKEVAARFLHDTSRRVAEPFTAVNCAAIPADLLESELFGHERGAFTGAHALHRGYAERAGAGTLFLDEIAELPMPVQAKLLRLAQDRVFTRVGGERLLPCAARIVCATNADLAARIREGRFREDLFFRIAVIPVEIPPLRARGRDVEDLLRLYVDRFVEMFGLAPMTPTPGALAAVRDYAWPGNVRELRNRVERAVALADGAAIRAPDLFPERRASYPSGDAVILPLATVRDEAERRHIEAALAATGGQVARTAELLDISRTTLWEKMRRLGLETGG